MAWRKPATAKEWVAILGRHKKKFFFPAVAMAMVVALASLKLPREFSAEAKFRRESPQETLDTNTQNNMNYFRLYQRMSEELAGRDAIDQLITDLKMDTDLPHKIDGELTPEGKMASNDLISKIKTRLYFYNDPSNADQFIIAYKDADPRLAAMIANRVMDNYISKTQATMGSMLEMQRQFYDQQLKSAEDKYNDLFTKKTQMETDYPDLDPNNQRSVKLKVDDLSARLEGARGEKAVCVEQSHRLEALLHDAPAKVEEVQYGENPDYTKLRDSLSHMQTDLDNDHGMGRKDTHPHTAKLIQQIATVEDQLSKVQQTIPISSVRKDNPAIPQLKAELESLNGKIVANERIINSLSADVAVNERLYRDFIKIRNEYTAILREYEDAGGQKAFFDANLRRVRLSIANTLRAKGINLIPVQRASEISRPSSPKIFMILAAALGAGCGVGALLILLSELLDHTFHSVEQAIDDLKLPVLGAVGEIVTPARALRRRLLSFGVYPVIGAVMAACLIVSVALAYYSLEDPPLFQRMVVRIGNIIPLVGVGS